MVLNWKQTNTVLQAAMKRADEIGVPMSISILDSEGHLAAYVRMNSRYYTSEVSQAKARVSALFAQPSNVHGEAMAQRIGERAVQGMSSIINGKLFWVKGGLPLSHGGQHMGGIGVSGGTADQDEDVARAGVTALTNLK